MAAAPRVKNVAGKDAFERGEQRGARIGGAIEFADDLGINPQAEIIFAGLGFFEGVGQRVGDEDVLADAIQHEQIEAREALGIVADAVQRGEEITGAVADARRGFGAVLIQGQAHDGVEVRFKVAQPIVAVLVVDVHVFGPSWVCIFGGRQEV